MINELRGLRRNNHLSTSRSSVNERSDKLDGHRVQTELRLIEHYGRPASFRWLLEKCGQRDKAKGTIG